MGRGRGGRGGRAGRGGRGGGGGEDSGGGYEDQYGASMVGQDRAEHYGFGGRGGSTGGGGTKGGDAGSRTKPGVDLSFVRHVPKFLQAHAHMLNKSVEEDEPEAALLKQKYDDDAKRGREEEEGDDDDERQESLRQAIAQDPSLLQQHPELQAVADQAAAEAVKVKGNAAFAAGKHEEAARLFTRCIELDGSNHIYYSNRAAAFTGLQDYGAAARDARRCTELKPHWAKGWSRLGAAYFGLEQFAEAREAYQAACRLEPNEAQLQVSLQRATAREEKEAAEGKHKFKRKLEPGGEQQQGKRPETVRRSAAKKEKTLLSFADDEVGSEDL